MERLFLSWIWGKSHKILQRHAGNWSNIISISPSFITVLNILKPPLGGRTTHVHVCVSSTGHRTQSLLHTKSSVNICGENKLESLSPDYKEIQTTFYCRKFRLNPRGTGYRLTWSIGKPCLRCHRRKCMGQGDGHQQRQRKPSANWSTE